jgi:hypothetical protein|nr:MAG TPA: hypothetical protein [Caudoviricetes sp.]DAT05387.1 MAG TPA: hypothetical protein [Caudoviricetes sp.]
MTAVLTFCCIALLVLIGYISVNITGELQARNKKLNINKRYLLALVFIGVSLIFYLVVFILPPYIFDIIF